MHGISEHHLVTYKGRQVMPMSAYEIIMVLLTGIGLLVVLIDKIGRR